MGQVDSNKVIPDPALPLAIPPDEPKRRAMLAALAKTGNVTTAAKLARVGRASHYRWARGDEDYRTAVREAMEEAADLMEAEAWRRAVTGTLEPVFHAGQRCGAIRRYSDALLKFLLMAARPEKYRPRYEVSGPHGGPIKTVDEGISADMTASDQRLARVLIFLERARQRQLAEELVGQANLADLADLDRAETQDEG